MVAGVLSNSIPNSFELQRISSGINPKNKPVPQAGSKILPPVNPMRDSISQILRMIFGSV